MKTLLTAALTSHIVPDMPPTPNRVWRAVLPMVQSGLGPAEILEAASALGEDVRQSIVRRLDSLADFESALGAYRAAGIEALSQFELDYPSKWVERLGDRAPALVFCSGNLAILNAGSLAVVGSRSIDEKGGTFAEEAAREIADRGAALVSGGARGVDSLAMRAAFSAGGSVLGVLADALAKATRDSAVAEMLESGRMCLCTPYSPDAPFSAGNAMGRNKLIYGHALASIVVASDLDAGGTWNGAVEALRLGLGTVLVRAGEGAPVGNMSLIQRGGIPIEQARDIWTAMLGSAAAQQALF